MRYKMKSLWMMQVSFVFLLCILSGCVWMNSASEPQVSGYRLKPSVVSAVVPDSQKYHDILAEELKGMLERNETFLLVDVRSPKEYDAGHIDKAINIPYVDTTDKSGEIKDKARALG